MARRPGLIHDIPARAADRHPDREALRTPSEVVTFADLAIRVEAMAAAWSAVGSTGDRVAVVGDNRVDYVVALYAVPAAGRVLTLVNQRLHPAEQAALLDRAEAIGVTGDRGRLRALREADPGPGARTWAPFGSDVVATRSLATGPDTHHRDPDAVAWLIHTSGTTGPAKGVGLRHTNLRAAVEAGARGRPVTEGDRYLFPFPLCHVAAYNVLLQHDRGATVLLPDGFDAGAVLGSVAEQRVTTLSLAPTMITRLLHHPGVAATDLASLRSIGYGAAALPPEVRARAEEVLGCTLVEGYGMTELSGNAAFDGVPDPEIDLRIVDEAGRPAPGATTGEVVARGDQVVDGYWCDDAATGEAFVDGWFHTGDLGRIDADGRLRIVDRKKDIIITGGENVASREVEEVLATVPGVREVAVIGLPDPEWGEQIAAVVVADPAERVGLPERLTDASRATLAGFKTPRRIELVDGLPVNAAGKVDKRELRDRFS